MEFNLPTEIETLLTNLLAQSNCFCHFINPKKTRVILWKEVQGEQEIYHLRIGLQRLISFACLDRNGETYWKFEIYSSEIKKPAVNHDKDPDTGSPVDPVTKFNQRQEKVLNYERSNDNHQPEPSN